MEISRRTDWFQCIWQHIAGLVSYSCFCHKKVYIDWITTKGFVQQHLPVVVVTRELQYCCFRTIHKTICRNRPGPNPKAQISFFPCNLSNNAGLFTTGGKNRFLKVPGPKAKNTIEFQFRYINSIFIWYIQSNLS